MASNSFAPAGRRETGRQFVNVCARPLRLYIGMTVACLHESEKVAVDTEILKMYDKELEMNGAHSRRTLLEVI